MKYGSIPASLAMLFVCAFLQPSHVNAQHAIGIMGDFMLNTYKMENANLGLRLSYDRALSDAWILRGSVGGMGGGQVALFEAVPKPEFPELPLDTVKVDERERYLHLTIGTRRYLLDGGFSKGGLYAHLGVHVGFWSYTADPVDYDEQRYQLPSIGPREQESTLLLFPVGLGFEKRFDRLVPFAEAAFMPGTSIGGVAESVLGWCFSLGLRLPFGESAE